MREGQNVSRKDAKRQKMITAPPKKGQLAKPTEPVEAERVSCARVAQTLR
jgi:hypothetical protein